MKGHMKDNEAHFYELEESKSVKLEHPHAKAA